MKQSVLIKIRGNKGYDHVKKFVEIGLVTKKKTGHTYELNLADSFHDYFNVQGLKREDELEEELKQNSDNLGDKE